MAKIGFIGLGNMGTPMALNLIKAHHAVTGFDVSPRGSEASRPRAALPACARGDAATE